MVGIKKHLLQYFLLITTLIAIIISLKLIGDLFWRFTVVFSLASFYLGYGTLHHHEEKRLSFQTFIEYLFIAAVILLVLVSIFI